MKRKIKAGELVLGTGLPAFTPAFATQTARTGVDFLWIDTEHSPFGAESLEAVPVLVRNQGVAPMIRVAWNDPHLIKKAMDVGASAIMVPQVNTAEEAARAVQYTFYPPIGQRGISPHWPHVAGRDWFETIRTANDETVLIVQIESVEAYRNLEAIAAVPGIDVLLVGPMDLSASLGKITDMPSMASCGFAARLAAMTRSSPSAANAVASAPPAARGAWRRARRIWSTGSYPACRCANSS